MKKIAGLFALSLVACSGAQQPATHTPAHSAWREELASPHPFGCGIAPIWAAHVVWIASEGPIAAFAAEHQEGDAPIPLPPDVAAHAPNAARVLIPTPDALCVATLGAPELFPAPIDQTVPSYGRAITGCGADHAPFALVCPDEAEVPDDLRWARFAWGDIGPIAPPGDPIVVRAYRQRDAITEPSQRARADAVSSPTELARGRAAHVTVGAEEIAAAQLGFSWFEGGVDVTTGCPAFELAPGAVYTRDREVWTRVAIGALYVGVLHDAAHVLALVEDGYDPETENCDDEHTCFYVGIRTLEGDTFIRRSRAITQLTSAFVASHSALRYLDVRPACANGDE